MDYSLKPVLNEENETVKRLGDEKEVLASVSTLNRFFLSSNSTAAHNGVYGSAFESFFLYQPAYQKELRKANYALYWSQVIMRVSFPLIFFLIIPLCFRDGKSIGRRLARSAVIDKNGYSAKKMRIFLHQFPLYAFFLTGLIPFDIIYYGALFLLPCADFLVKLLSKDRRSAHEYIAGTLTVDDDESEYFSSKDEKDEFLASHMVGIRKSKPKKEEPVYEEIKENKPPVEENKEGKQAEEIVTKKPSGHGELDEDSFLDEQGE